jgi:hypothetical protein
MKRLGRNTRSVLLLIDVSRIGRATATGGDTALVGKAYSIRAQGGIRLKVD